MAKGRAPSEPGNSVSLTRTGCYFDKGLCPLCAAFAEPPGIYAGWNWISKLSSILSLSPGVETN